MLNDLIVLGALALNGFFGKALYLKRLSKIIFDVKYMLGLRSLFDDVLKFLIGFLFKLTPATSSEI
jgi:hypothetical protein